MSPYAIGGIGILLLLAFTFARMPVGFAMCIVGFVGLVWVGGIDVGLLMIGAVPFEWTHSYVIAVVPLFIVMGEFISGSGVASDTYKAMYTLIGHFRGGLAMATTGACTAFAAVTGSGTAVAAIVGKIALPEMKKYNYHPRLATGCIAGSCGLGGMIPPSITFILYGLITRTSIGKLFIAGIVPGLLLSFMYFVTIHLLCRLNPAMGPRGPATNFKEKVVALRGVWGVLALFLLVIGGIYMGIFTPTEGGGIGVAGAFLFLFIKRVFSWQRLGAMLLDAGMVNAMCFIIIIGAVIFGQFLGVSRFTPDLAAFVGELPVNRYLIFGAIVMVFLIAGCIMDLWAIVLVAVPIFFPIIVDLGFDPIWFGVIFQVTCQMGAITPPVGINAFIVKGVAPDIPLSTIFRGIVPFLVPNAIMIILLTAFPQICLFLPSTMMK